MEWKIKGAFVYNSSDKKRIQITNRFGAIASSANNALAGPIAPGGAGESTVAAKAAGVAAGHQIVGRESEVDIAVRVDAHLENGSKQKCESLANETKGESARNESQTKG